MLIENKKTRLVSRQDHPGSLFGDHHGRGIGISRGDGGHDRGIGNAKAGDVMDPKLRVHHRHRVCLETHLSGPDRMENGRAQRPGGGQEVRV